MRVLPPGKLSNLLILGTILAFGLNGPLHADTQIQTVNDGIGISAYASSSEVILSMNIRVVGPNDFVFENRVEDDFIDWAPEKELPDGLYTWEVWTVTAERGAPTREISLPRQTTQADQSVDSISTHQSMDQTAADLKQIPLERLFAPEFKHVHKTSGSFRAENGMMQEVADHERMPLSKQNKPNAIQRAIGAALDLLVSSAHANTTTENVTIIKTNPQVNFDDDRTDIRMQLLGNMNGFFLREFDDGTFQGTPLRVAQGAPESSIAIRSGTTPQVGIGTSTPTEGLHISRTSPRIRLQNTSNAQNWYINNVNAGRFEIRETVDGGIGAFAIEAGAPEAALYVAANGRVGIGTNNPTDPLHVKGNQAIRLESDFGDGDWRMLTGSGGLVFENMVTSGFVLQMSNAAPHRSMYISDEGNVGLGTNNPAQKLHVAGNAHVSGSVGVGITEPMRTLHVHRDDGSARLEVSDSEPTDFQQVLFELSAQGNPQFRFSNNATDRVWNFRTQDYAECSESNTCFVINKRNGPRFRFMQDGDMFIEGAYENSSSRTVKNSISSLNPNDLFERLQRVGFYEWSYDHSPDTRHVGPMAEDFYAAFGLGSGEKSISPSNMAGISLAATKALQNRVQATEIENAELRARMEMLEAKLAN